MPNRLRLIMLSALLFHILLMAEAAHAKPFTLNARSAILVDTSSGEVLYEQNPDSLIAPASVTKILTLYIAFDAIRDGRLHLWDKVQVSRRAARTGGSRMGLRAGTEVTLDELIKGMAVVSGNDACVAFAEHMSGTVEEFVSLMNQKARDLGMANTVFKTPNGLPAKGQVTTARDMAKLSMAYLRRFPDSLTIHSMRSYTYKNSTHQNANRLLGKCSGVDGIKTGFVCASGFNLSATAKRGESRLIAVVMGAPSPYIRTCEAAKLLELGFHKVAPDLADTRFVQSLESGSDFKLPEEASCAVPRKSGKHFGMKRGSSRLAAAAVSKAQGNTAETIKTAHAKRGTIHRSPSVATASKEADAKRLARESAGVPKSRVPGATPASRKTEKIGSDGESVTSPSKTKKKSTASKEGNNSKNTSSKKKAQEPKSANSGQKAAKSCSVTQAKPGKTSSQKGRI